MEIKVEERERNACRIRRKLPFSVAKHRGSETRGSEMSVITNSRDAPTSITYIPSRVVKDFYVSKFTLKVCCIVFAFAVTLTILTIHVAPGFGIYTYKTPLLSRGRSHVFHKRKVDGSRK